MLKMINVGGGVTVAAVLTVLRPLSLSLSHLSLSLLSHSHSISLLSLSRIIGQAVLRKQSFAGEFPQTKDLPRRQGKLVCPTSPVYLMCFFFSPLCTEG